MNTKLESIYNRVTTQLSLSDRVINGNLLRFYRPKWFKKVQIKDYDYNKKVSLEKLEDSNVKTSLRYRNHKKSTESKFKTDAPELKK